MLRWLDNYSNPLWIGSIDKRRIVYEERLIVWSYMWWVVTLVEYDIWSRHNLEESDCCLDDSLVLNV
jgi:hypothetical protein